MSELHGAEWTLSNQKRIFDMVGMTALLPAVLPASALAAVAIRSMDEVDPFFVQSRLGLGFEPFNIYKFRTMPIDTPDTPSLGSSNDPRATRLGKKLRRSHFDELPQSINVYNGTLALVGLRALIRQDIEDTLKVLNPTEKVEWKQARRTVKPAVFGPFQLEQHISGYDKGEINYRRALSDIEYANTATFKGDLDILKRTALEGTGFNTLLARDTAGRKRGQRGASMLKNVANGMGVTVSADEVDYWRVALHAARVIDDQVDNANLASSAHLVASLLNGNPIGEMTKLEARDFSEIFASLPTHRQVRLQNSFLALPNLLLQKRSATTAQELLAVNNAEAKIFAEILELEFVNHEPDERRSFNNWLANFVLAGYMADACLDTGKDFAAGNITLEPKKSLRIMFGIRAASEIKDLIKVTPVRSYIPLLASSARILAK